MQHTGILLNRSEIKTFETGFQVQEFYMDCKTYDQNTGQEYPNTLKFQVIGDRIPLLTAINRGEKITVSYNIKGRLFEKEDGTKGHIQNLNVWKIEKFKNFQPVQQSPSYQGYQQPAASNFEDEDDDLPF